jgi:hypothetical protein
MLEEGGDPGNIQRDLICELSGRLSQAALDSSEENAGSLPRLILRALEVLIGAQSTLRYSSTPDIVLETACMRAALPETYNDRVAIGDTLPVILPSGARTTGKVIFKAVEGDFATQRDVSRRKRDIKTVGLKLKVDNSNKTLVPGLTATVIIPNERLKQQTAEKK